MADQDFIGEEPHSQSVETIETCPESLETTGKESDENTATEDELSVATNRTLSNEHEYKPLDTIDNTVIETAESNEDASINDNNLCIGQMDIGEDNGSHGDNRQSFEEVRFSDTSTTDAKTVVLSTEVHVQNTCSTDLSNTGSHDEQPTSENTCMSINDETDKLQHNSCEEQENVDTQEEQLDVHVTTCASSIGQSISDMSCDEDNTRSISPTSELQTSITSNNDTPSICLLQSQSGSESSFVMIDENSLLVDASKFEESGLFYGSDLQRNRGIVHEDRLPTPPPESADDVLLSENVAREMTGQRSSVTPGNDSETSSSDHQSIDSLIENTSSHKKIVTSKKKIDPRFILELEQQALELSDGLEVAMNGLQSNLHAMSMCAQQSIVLQRETISDVQHNVDSSVKAMYTFLSKFNELYDSLQPIQELSNQISEVNENLKVLERIF